MAERKVTSKYYPPNFDPDYVKKRKRDPDDKNKDPKITMMIPFKMKCTNPSCEHDIGAHTTIRNVKKTIMDETYLGITRYRFYFKCPGGCQSEMSIYTDPESKLPSFRSISTRIN